MFVTRGLKVLLQLVSQIRALCGQVVKKLVFHHLALSTSMWLWVSNPADKDKKELLSCPDVISQHCQ